MFPPSWEKAVGLTAARSLARACGADGRASHSVYGRAQARRPSPNAFTGYRHSSAR
ncbi:hypothetical protein COLSTE_00599 [Collinsella stercoris DSM 13279]|uniref:Uncharacterized protein n=1 Tax=Collinsella stercoris DSM 13279 TaxID=445975 RepID=B6G958_9ACTN|nr:hypothetical protein COLSTE_00599 [Collinsella stercoris DSM 13279]